MFEDEFPLFFPSLGGEWGMELSSRWSSARLSEDEGGDHPCCRLLPGLGGHDPGCQGHWVAIGLDAQGCWGAMTLATLTQHGLGLGGQVNGRPVLLGAQGVASQAKGCPRAGQPLVWPPKPLGGQDVGRPAQPSPGPPCSTFSYPEVSTCDADLQKGCLHNSS